MNGRQTNFKPPEKGGTSINAISFQYLGLRQLVPFATHLHPDGSLGSCIDLMFSSAPQCCQSIKSLPPLGSSDHVRIECSLHLQPSIAQNSSRPRRIWNFGKVDFDKLNKSLAECDWSSVSNAATVNDAWKAWKDVFLTHVNKAVPSKVITASKPKVPWMSAKLRELIKAKHAAWRQYKKSIAAATRDAF